MTRVALYFEAPGPGVISCSGDARRNGERVVVMASEGDDRRQGRQVLHALVERMVAGEFDAIVAAMSSRETALMQAASGASRLRTPPSPVPIRLLRLSCSEVNR